MTDYRKQDSWLYMTKAIREKCLDCCGQQRAEVRKCHIFDCPLWPYRFGKGPGNHSFVSSHPEVFDIDDLREAQEYMGSRPVEELERAGYCWPNAGVRKNKKRSRHCGQGLIGFLKFFKIFLGGLPMIYFLGLVLVFILILCGDSDTGGLRSAVFTIFFFAAVGVVAYISIETNTGLTEQRLEARAICELASSVAGGPRGGTVEWCKYLVDKYNKDLGRWQESKGGSWFWGLPFLISDTVLDLEPLP